jgi:hypothetical protein
MSPANNLDTILAADQEARLCAQHWLTQYHSDFLKSSY